MKHMVTGVVSVYVFQLITIDKNDVNLGIFLNNDMIEYYPRIHKQFAERIINNKKLGFNNEYKIS